MKPEHKLKSVDAKSRLPLPLCITVQCLLGIYRRHQEEDVTDRAEKGSINNASGSWRERWSGTTLVGRSTKDAARSVPDRSEMCMTDGLVKL